MTDYLVFTDAGGDIPPQICREYDINGVPMEVILNGTGDFFSPDDEERDSRCQAFYDAIKDRKAEVSTTQITPYIFTEAFGKHLEEGKDILYCCFSSGMSGTWQNAMAAKEMLKEQYPDRNIRFVDSLSAAGGQGTFAVQAAINRNKGMSLEENAVWLEEHRQNVNHWFTVDDLDFLKRGGRVSPAVAFIGGRLQIKPILTIMPDGSLKMCDKVKGRKHSIKKLVDLYKENMEYIEGTSVIFVNYAGCPDEGEALAAAVREISPEGTMVMPVALSPIIGAHTGPNMLSVTYFGKKRSEK